MLNNKEDIKNFEKYCKEKSTMYSGVWILNHTLFRGYDNSKYDCIAVKVKKDNIPTKIIKII